MGVLVPLQARSLAWKWLYDTVEKTEIASNTNLILLFLVMKYIRQGVLASLTQSTQVAWYRTGLEKA